MNRSNKHVGTMGLHRLVLVAAVAVAAFVGITGLWCNAQPAYRQNGGDIVITFSVVNRWGRFVTLGRDDFTIYQEQRPQEALRFVSESELPLRLALLVDTSNSLREHFSAIQQAATTFINDTIRPDCDEAMLVSFDTVSEVVAAFSDRKQVAEKIRDLRPGGGTTLYDAVDLTARRMSEATRGNSSMRLAIVILSDGDDNQSRLTRDQALEGAQRANAVVFAVSTTMQRVPTIGDKVLKYLTSETGGIALFPSSVEDLGHSFGSITQQLRHQFQVWYRPEPLHADGKFHIFEIRPRSKGLTIRARKGYYAPSTRSPSEFNGDYR